MIIPQLTEEEKLNKKVNNSRGEYLVLEKLASISRSRGWIVYRSLRLENHPNKLEGEIDVVVFANELGIILLEVKGSKLRSSDGQWTVFNHAQNDWVSIQDPFEQIKDASFAFRSETKYLFDNFRVNPMISWGCVFPECDEIRGTVSYPSWRFCTASKLDDIDLFIIDLAKKERNKLSNLERRNIGGLDIRTAYKVLENLAPVKQEGQFIDPEYNELLFVLDKETELVRTLVKSFAYNKIIFAEGAAGTGKTKAALFESERILKNGQSLLFICRSNALALSIERYLSNFDDSGVCTVIAYDRMTQDILNHLTDAVIIDEAQDIAHEPLIRELLARHLDSGAAIRIFGDFDCQNLFSDKKDLINWFSSKGVIPSIFKLTTNCRNTLQIGEKIQNMVDLDSSEFSLSSANGEPIDIRNGVTRKDLPKMIIDISENWVEKGNPLSAITVLKYDQYRQLQDEEMLLNEIDAIQFGEKYERDYHGILFSSVMEFKGLESPCVIFVVDQIDENWETIFYIALSRARVKCYVIFLDQIKGEELIKILWKISGTK